MRRRAVCTAIRTKLRTCKQQWTASCVPSHRCTTDTDCACAACELCRRAGVQTRWRYILRTARPSYGQQVIRFRLLRLKASA